MNDGTLRIQIEAGLGRSVEATFGTLEKMAERTARNVTKRFGGGTFKGFATDADKAAKSAEASFARQAKAAEKSLKDEHRAFDRAARDKVRLLERGERDQERVMRQQTRNAEREAANQVKIAENAAKKIDADRSRFASRTSQRAVRFLFPNPIGAFGMASRIGGDIMRGAGVDFGIGSSVSRVVDMSSRISQLKNQAAMNGQNVSHAELEGSVKGASDKYGFSRGDTAEALSKYIDKTGDAATGMQVLGKMAERAAASGGSIADMMDAAGDVALNLGPVKDKAKALTGVMDAMTVQGAKGAIEIKNLASSGMSRIASSAGRYEGDSGQNMVKLGALAQLARQSGGAASPAEAANAVSRLTDQLATPTRAKQFSARGIDVMSKTEHGQLRDPVAIIRDALLKTNGDPLALKKLFASTVGAKPVLALSKEFNSAGGGQAGLAAVDKLIAGFMEAADIQKKLDKANAGHDDETSTKTQKFQNSLDDVTEKMAGELLPTLDRLKQPALDVASAFGKVVEFAAKNPLEAVGVAIAAAIARASIESAFRAGIEKMITGAAGGGISIAGAGLGVTIGAATVVMHLIDDDIHKKEEEQRRLAMENAGQGVTENDFRFGAKQGTYTEAGKKGIESIDANLEGRIKRAETIGQLDAANGGAPTGAALALETMLSPERQQARLERGHLEELKAELSENKRLLEMIRTGVLKVQVTNLPGIDPPGVNPDGRQPPVGRGGGRR